MAPPKVATWRQVQRVRAQQLAEPSGSADAIQAAFARRLEAMRSLSCSQLCIDVSPQLCEHDFATLLEMTLCAPILYCHSTVPVCALTRTHFLWSEDGSLPAGHSPYVHAFAVLCRAPNWKSVRITSIVSSDCPLSPSALAGLTTFMRATPSVTALSIARCPSLGVPRALSGFRALLMNKQCALKSLSISQSPMPLAAVLALTEPLSFNSTVTSLQLTECSLDASSVTAVAEMLEQSIVLQSLDLCWNVFPAAAVPFFEGHMSLRQLHLASCSISDAGLVTLSGMLATLPGTPTFRLTEV